MSTSLRDRIAAELIRFHNDRDKPSKRADGVTDSWGIEAEKIIEIVDAGDERVITLDDLKRLRDGFSPPVEQFDGNISDRDELLLDRIDDLIAELANGAGA